MKVSAITLFAMVAGGFLFSALHTAEAAGIPSLQPAPGGQSQLCGCDTKQGIETYVQNVLNDAQQRGMTCVSSMHIPACIISYCSICGNDPQLMANCVQTGMDYLTASCAQQQPQLTAAYMPMPGFGF